MFGIICYGNERNISKLKFKLKTFCVEKLKSYVQIKKIKKSATKEAGYKVTLTDKSGKSLHRGKGMVPHAQLPINYGLGCLLIEKKISNSPTANFTAG